MTSNTFNQSPNDKRIYKFIQLNNKLDVLLIQDKDTKISNASLTVGIGSFDEEEVFGLAHFLEHMLFLGSKKYPDDDYYNNIIGDNGGYSNAYTSDDHTCYYFSIQNEFFDKCLDVFGQFFIDPLFKEDSVSREKNAVDSEHKKNISSDLWRYGQLLAEVSNKKTPLSKFNVGNLETLDVPNIRDLVVDFYNRFYSSHIMKLVILTNKPVNEIENTVIDIFSKIPLRKTSVYRNYEKPLITPRYIEVVPIKTENRLMIYWQLPYWNNLHKWNPYNFMSHILGHEGPNTVIDTLKQNGLINSMSCSLENIVGSHCLYYVNINLTSLGKNKHTLILDTLYSYIKLYIDTFKKDSTEFERIYEELNFVSLMNYNNLQINKLDDYSVKLSSNWCKYNLPNDKVISFGHLSDKHDETYVNLTIDLLNYLTPNNSIIFYASKEFKNNTKLVEKWYGIEYNLYERTIYHFHNQNINNLKIIRKNPFICTNYDMVKNNSITKDPFLIRNDNKIKVYWKYDKTFNVPKVRFIASIKLFNIISSASTYCKLQLYNKCIKHVLNPYLYELDMASYDVNIHLSFDELIMSVYGYSEKILDVVNFLIDSYIFTNFNKIAFEICKENYTKNLQNKKYNAPYTLVNDIYNKQMNNKFYDYNDLLHVINNINYENVVNSAKYIFDRASITSLICGNIDIISALKLSNQLYRFINIGDTKNQDNTNLQLNTDTPFSKIEKSQNETEKNTATVIYFPIGYYRPDNTNEWKKQKLLLDILDMAVGKEFYNDLRTLQQLGYIVSSNKYSIGSNRMPFISYFFLVQSNHKKTQYLENKIYEFLTKYYENIQNISDDMFNNYLTALKHQLMDPEKTLYSESNFIFNCISSTEDVFNIKELLLDELSNIKKEELITFYKKFIIDNKPSLVSVESIL